MIVDHMRMVRVKELHMQGMHDLKSAQKVNDGQTDMREDSKMLLTSPSRYYHWPPN